MGLLPQMAASGQRFLINQFGLAMFRWDGRRYIARTYNFYLFPRPFQGYDRRFLCQVMLGLHATPVHPTLHLSRKL